MPSSRLLTASIVQAVALGTGRPVNLITGIVGTGHGVQVAVRVGGVAGVILPPGVASELVFGLREAVATKRGEGR